MNKNLNFIKQAFRIILAAPIGYWIANVQFTIESSMFKIVIYFATYIVISIILELIFKLFEKKQIR